MPLPVSDTVSPWPPKELDQIFAHMRQWSAWYTGDLARLQAAYGGGVIQDSTGFFASDQGGFKATVGRTLQRWFVGEPTRGPDRNAKLPLPIAAEMCQASADLLFSDPVTITVTDKATQARLDELIADNAHSTFAEASEICAALGGTYLRVTWDELSHPEGPFTTIVDADQAIPEFRFGRLWGVTFWTVVARDGKTVWRHLERHELDATGVGVILHGLYQGEENKLGTRVSLTNIAATAPLAATADLGIEGTITTSSPGLAVEYIPNQTPNRLWRTDPIGRHLGRSDMDGVEHLMDQLAEVMSAWARAVRLGKARIMLSKELLKNAGPGNGMVGNIEQEAFTTLTTLGGKDLTLADQVQFFQPTIDHASYKATADALIEQILQMSGYSLETFAAGGGNGGGAQKTATEVEQRQQRSLMTRARKIREWRPALERHLTKLLDVDRAVFGTPNVTTDLVVEFADGVQESQLKLAQTVQALFAAESASLQERVTILHPDWDEDMVSDEVDLIKAEFAHPDPLTDPAMAPFGEPDGDEPAPTQ